MLRGCSEPWVKVEVKASIVVGLVGLGWLVGCLERWRELLRVGLMRSKSRREYVLISYNRVVSPLLCLQSLGDE